MSYPVLPPHGGSQRDHARAINYLLNQTGLTVTWGGITGTLSDQTDLQTALDGKLTVEDGGGSYVGYPKYVAETGFFVENAAGLRAFLAVDGADLGQLYLENSDGSTHVALGGTLNASGIPLFTSHPIAFNNTPTVNTNLIYHEGNHIPITTSGHTIATNRLAGRTTAGVGAIEAISVGAGLSLAAGVLSATGGGTTTNALTITNTGGAAAGTTFDGSAARTIDYSTVGAAKTGAVTGSGLTASATDKVVGRSSAGSGALEEITFTSAARALCDDADARAMCKTLQAGYVLGQSAVASSHTGDLLEFTFATITVPANAIGANGRIEIECHFSFTGSANNKTLKVKFGGSNILNLTVSGATNVNAFYNPRISNRNATNSQETIVGNTVGSGTSSTASTLAIDTTASKDIVITGQLANSGETVTLESYRVILYARD